MLGLSFKSPNNQFYLQTIKTPVISIKTSSSLRCFKLLSSFRFIESNRIHRLNTFTVRFTPPDSNDQKQPQDDEYVDVVDDDDENNLVKVLASTTGFKQDFLQGNSAIVSACFIGLLTGISVVLFNYGVLGIRDFVWDGLPNRGVSSWLREEPLEVIWKPVILIPVCGGVIVSMLNIVAEWLARLDKGILNSNVKSALPAILKALAACVTLGTGNSLGPEGPSVEIGASISKGYGTLFDRSPQRKISLLAAGSAAGIASGFNAAVAGCFFAIESVLWPSAASSSLSQSNTTSMVILSAVIASVVSEVGLGSEPAFKVPEYDFQSPSELPLYLLLGLLCGLVSLTLTTCTSYLLVSVENLHKSSNIPKAMFPILGSLATGLIALLYPEILYRGFENVDILLESQPFVKGLSADLLVQLVVAKIVATSLCRASGLVGGYYAPSLFIGAATGMAYGKFISFAISQVNPVLHLSVLEVASPQAYGLVGMAATLAGVCQVPLTSVLLLFELTQDYRIVVPLLGAVGLSSWITSRKIKERNPPNSKNIKTPSSNSAEKSELSSENTSGSSSEASFESELCKLESSLCVGDSNKDLGETEKTVLVSESMRRSYVSVLMETSLLQALHLMLAEKQSCALVVDGHNFLLALITIEGIQEFSKLAKTKGATPKELLVYDMCSSNVKECHISWTVTPDMDIYYARTIMNRHGLRHIPVTLENAEQGNRPQPIGLLDRDCIDLACRVAETRELLG